MDDVGIQTASLEISDPDLRQNNFFYIEGTDLSLFSSFSFTHPFPFNIGRSGSPWDQSRADCALFFTASLVWRHEMMHKQAPTTFCIHPVVVTCVLSSSCMAALVARLPGLKW